MPSLTQTRQTLLAEGPTVNVEFQIPSALEKKYKKENKPIPEPIKVTSLIDTGASHCVIQKDIPDKLGLKPLDKIKINTASCKNHECYLYFLRMVIRYGTHSLDYEGKFSALSLEGQNIDCLIGRDLLAHGILIYIGYANQFTLSLM